MAAKRAVELGLSGCHGLDVVGEVVSCAAREDSAAGHLGLGGGAVLAGRPHLVNAGDVCGIDDGRDIKVGDVVPALEGDFAEHALGVGGVLANGEPVANPSSRESDGLGGSSCNLNGADLGVTNTGSEDNLSASAVLADESDSVGGANDRTGGSNDGSNLGEETHFD